MKKSLRIFFLSTVLIMIGCLIIPGSSAFAAEKVIKWKCQTNIPAGSTHYVASNQLVVDEIRKRTNGRLDIQLFAAGALMPSKEIFPAVKRGTIQIGHTGPAYFRAQVPLAGVMAGIPFNAKKPWEWMYILEHMGLEKLMQAEMAKQGLYYRSDMVSRSMLALKKSVQTLAAFKGLKLRSSGISQVFLKSIGAAASYIPGEEIYAALASGVVEGAHWGAVKGNTDMGFFEICPYFLDEPLNICSGDCWLINKEAFNKLPKDIQNIVTSLLDEHFFKRSNQYIFQEESTLNNNKKKYGTKVIYFEPGEYAKMVAEGMKIWEDLAKKDPASAKGIEIIKEFNKMMGRM